MEEETVYGMLMKRIRISEEFYMFSPVHLINGIMIGDTVFTDELGIEYAVINGNEDYNQSIMYVQEEFWIGFYVKENELMESYPDDIIENAKMKFYDETKNHHILAYYDEKSEVFRFMPLDLKMFTNSLAESTKTPSLPIQQNEEDFIEEEISLESNDVIKDGERLMMMNETEIGYLLDMLNNKDYDKLVETLKSIKNVLANNGQVEPIIKEEITPAAKEEETIKNSSDNIDVNDLYANIKKKIIDQDEALKDIVTAIKMDQYAKHPSERSRCFIIGPTGSGKTKTLECLSEYLNKPFIKIDTTQLTTPGYVGGHIEEQLTKLVNISNGDIKKAENGIVVFDEIDKKCGTRDEIFGKGFLFTLLPFLDGTDYIINVDSNKKQIFNTSNLTIFASGSFLDVIKSHSLEKAPLGFNAQIKTDNNKNKLNPEEIFKKSGMPDEFIGRFPVVVQLNELGIESLKKILNESEISQLKAEKRKFDCLGVNLSWEEKYVEAVAREAKKLNRGARSLKKIVERTIKYMRWEILTNPNKYQEAMLLEESVENPKIYKLK